MQFDKITEYLDSLLDKGIPSFDCIICRDNREIYRHMGGKVDFNHRIGVSEDTLYLVFSMTKIQTMTAVMQLVEQGRISLEDEVARYLPAYANLKVETEKNGEKTVEDCDTPMLIKHLVSMQSGLDYDLNRAGIASVLRARGMQATTREIVDSFPLTPLKFKPGTHFLYSLSHDVIAAIIEVVSGMSFGEYLKENIWKPLGMTDTYFAKPINTGDRLADQYIYMDPPGVIVPMQPSCCYQISDAYESGGAGLISNTKDYSILADTLACGGLCRNGNRILKAETIDIIRTNLLGEDSLRDIASSMGRVGYGYGCGMQVLMKPDLINSPAMPGVFGWDGAAGSCTIMYPEKKISLVYMMHVRNFGYSYSTIHPRLRDFLFED